MNITELVREMLAVADWGILTYFLVLNTIYLLLVALAAFDMIAHFRHRATPTHDALFTSPLTLPVSVILPAHNEEVVIVDSVRAMLALRYPQFEVVVIDDGSVDATFDRLVDAFDLVEVPVVVPPLVRVVGEIHSTHVARDGSSLVVVRKTSAGSKADAVNAGICVARYPLLCITDADAILDEDALLHVAKPFADDPLRTVATGGVVRPVNDCRVYRGRVVDVRIPKRWLARIQVVEYLRAFLLGRAGWSRLGGLMIISGAFGLFRRDLVVEIGGLRHEAKGEDADLVARLHRHLREAKRPHRIAFVSEPVCWTEVPETFAVLGRQRRRWSRGLAEVIASQRRMVFNPRYGRIGLVALPYFLVFELLGPLVELFGVVAVILGLSVGAVNADFALLFFLVAVGYGIFLSLVSLVVEVLSFHRYHRWSDLVAYMTSSVLENLGYRQLHAWWRLKGLWSWVRRTELPWGVMTRTGFTPEDPVPAGAPAKPAKVPALAGAGAATPQPAPIGSSDPLEQ